MHILRKGRAPTATYVVAVVFAVLCDSLTRLAAAETFTAQQWDVFEQSFTSGKAYDNRFTEVEVDVIFRHEDREWVVPSFWAGGDRWTVRFAPPLPGDYTFRVQCSDAANQQLNGPEQRLRVTAYTGENPLRKHGFLRVAKDKRHFEHADGTPFLWLGDTWWKCLCKRMTWEGFQELTADRKAKGFNVVQIVCGPYPDEEMMEARWENEHGKPYEKKDFTVVNPAYFDLADRRLRHLVENGMVPAIVGGWGRPQGGGQPTIVQVGLEGYKRHWRQLIARFGAYPVVWILGGEASDGNGPWADLAKYVHDTDPLHHLLVYHAPEDPRTAIRMHNELFDFDMVGIGHDGMTTVGSTLALIKSCLTQTPARPALCGEACYEGHMQTNFGDIQRRMFWSFILSGAAGHTYGAAGIWHAGVEGDAGHTGFSGHPYDHTTWKEGMAYPGAMQVGLGKMLLEKYPWHRFEPHPEWVREGLFAAGIPGEVRFIYQPRRGLYDWAGTVVRNLEPGVTYRVFYFDPATARRFDRGTVTCTGPAPALFEGHAKPLLLDETFHNGDADSWKDYGTGTRRENSRLIGGKGMVSVAQKVSGQDLMASVDAHSDAEAGIILRFRDPDNYLVALYSPLLKSIFLHDRKNGEWGEKLGRVDVPEVGPKIHLVAAACGEFAAFVLTDGQRTYATPAVKLGKAAAGKTGLWMFQIGDRQQFSRFAVSATPFDPPKSDVQAAPPGVVSGTEYHAPSLPSPQDWVLVMEKVMPKGK